jgi:alkylation response protein AidB-like acyl-CoA dehydrogenase
MADKDEYSFVVADPYDSFLGYSDVKVTSTFASDEPDRRGVSLLIIHGDEKDGWRAEKPKAKFLLINMPFKTLTVKRLALKKKTILGVYMEEKGEGEEMSSVIFWDGKKYRYQALGSTLE